MAAANLTAYDKAIRTLWASQVTETALIEESPLFGLIKTSTDFFEKDKQILFGASTNQGLSATFANAKANSSRSEFKDNRVTPSEYFGVARWSRRILKRSNNRKAMIVDALDRELNTTRTNLTKELSFQLHRSGGCMRGRLSHTTTLNTPTVTLADKYQALLFEVGMVVAVSSDNGLGGAGVRAGTLTITGINPRTGTLTFSQNANTGIAAIAVDDYIFRDGDYGLGWTGFDAWIPATVTSTAFYGLDRTADEFRYAGLRYTNTGGTPLEQIDNALSFANVYGAKPDIGVVNPVVWKAVERSLQNKSNIVRIENSKGLKDSSGMTIGWEAIRLRGPKSTIDLIACPWREVESGLLLKKDTWEIISAGDLIQIFDDDGLKIRASESANEYESRMGTDSQVVCHSPKDNCRFATGLTFDDAI